MDGLTLIYKQKPNMDPQQQGEHEPGEGHPTVDYSQMSQIERQAQFRKQHQEYIAEKLARKKHLMEQVKAEFGSSSSDSDSDDDQPQNASESSRSSLGKAGAEKPIATKMESKQGSKKGQEAGQKIAVMICPKKGGDWVKDALVICPNNTINLSNFAYELKDFSKIKLISEPVKGIPYRIKITSKQNEILLATSNEDLCGLPSHYYVFARLIQDKLILQGAKIKQCIIEKVPGVPESMATNAFIVGKLNKKSQVLGNWDERFVVINKEGIFSYKKFNQKHSMSISNGSIKEIWTRYQIQENLLIVKVHHNGSKKTEFGFPLMDFLNTRNWLFHFCCMLGKK